MSDEPQFTTDPMKCHCLSWARDWRLGDISNDFSRVLTHHERCPTSEDSNYVFYDPCQECDPMGTGRCHGHPIAAVEGVD